MFIELFLYAFSKFLDKYRDGDFFFWLFQIQFQFFTLNTENSDKTKSRTLI